ncbi:MAG TPA: alanine--tRNA ligase, partial [Trueperaceae bacterium]|nr:alanine--tRNA ligase [Trueperaceae bacterium]
IDKEGYDLARAKAREISKADAGEVDVFAADNNVLADIAAKHGETEFLGYEQDSVEAKIIAIVKDNELVEQANENENIEIILDKTPFYAEGGGQVGDVGMLEHNQNKIIISNTQKNAQGLFIHKAKILRGQIKIGDSVTAKVDPIRQETKKHHSATHLLHKALRQVLGTHVAQAGSLVAPDRLRFDFSHPQALSSDEIKEIELLVNKDIQANNPVDWQVVAIEQARKAGAMMLFGEKYGNNVRMVKMGDSIELCGGLHVERTGDIGSFIIISEDSVSAGVRRLEAITGLTAIEYIRNLQDSSNNLARKLGVKPEELNERISKLQNDLKQSQRDITKLRDKLASAQTAGGTTTELKEAAGFKYLTSILKDLDANTLRNTADNLLDKSGADIVVLASGKLLVTKVSKTAQARGAHAGNIIREVAKIAGGGGGGRPDMAQAGIKDPEKLQTALDALADILDQ